MSSNEPSVFSIAFADTAAIGHVNVGVELYKALEAYAREERGPDEQIDFSKVIELGVPAITNLALGLELLLKTHHFQISGEFRRGHDIQELGRSFPEDTLESLRTYYKELFDDPAVSNGIIFRISGGSGGSERNQSFSGPETPDYDSAIAYIGPMYVRWRYFYEEFGEELDTYASYAPLYFSAMAVHRVIREYRGNTRVTVSDGLPDT